MSEEETYVPMVGTLDRNETDIEEVLKFILNHDDPGQRGNALLRLEELGPEMSVEDLDFSIELLKHGRKKEEVSKFVRKIDKILNEFWKYKKGLEFDGLEKPISTETKARIVQKKKEYAAALKEQKFSDPIQGETIDHLANLQALPAIENHLSWIALWAKITIILTIIFLILTLEAMDAARI